MLTAATVKTIESHLVQAAAVIKTVPVEVPESPVVQNIPTVGKTKVSLIRLQRVIDNARVAEREV